MTATVNYTDIQTEEMTAVYGACKTEDERKNAVEDLAIKFGKNVQSIRAKLTRIGCYISPNKKTKKVVRKADMVADIAELVGIEGNELDSLEKASVQALEIMLAHCQFMDK